MAFTVTQSPEPLTGDHVVTVEVSLSLAETSALFLAGDSLVSWPEQSSVGVLAADSALHNGGLQETGGLQRTGMFISELARLAQGLNLRYRQPAEAERAATLIRLQLLRAGVAEEI